MKQKDWEKPSRQPLPKRSTTFVDAVRLTDLLYDNENNHYQNDKMHTMPLQKCTSDSMSHLTMNDPRADVVTESPVRHDAKTGPAKFDKHTNTEAKLSSTKRLSLVLKSLGTSVPFVLAMSLLLLLSPCLPSFVSGLLWGFFVSILLLLKLVFISKPLNGHNGRLSDSHDLRVVFEEFDLRRRSHHDIIYRGWLNELSGPYDPCIYHVNDTHSVLVRLDGRTLRISRPQRNVYRHSFFNDPTLDRPDPTMVAQRLYDLTGAKVTLLPESLATRRRWSRKYPICIKLAGRQSQVSSVDVLSKQWGRLSGCDYEAEAEDNGDDEDGPIEVGESPAECRARNAQSKTNKSDSDLNRTSSTLKTTAIGAAKKRLRKSPGISLHLFVRSAREKERWFHRLRETVSRFDVKPLENHSSTSMSQLNSHTHFAHDEHFLYRRNAVQFSRYMADMVSNECTNECDAGPMWMDLGRRRVRNVDTHVDTTSQLVAAANALAIRLFYDFCRDDYWIKAVQNKIQTKLSAINLPYFIDTLELSRLDLGTDAPRIVGVHTPLVDDWGLWTDLEIHYSGALTLELETKVNVMKLRFSSSNWSSTTIDKAETAAVDGGQRWRFSDEERPLSPESSPDEDLAIYAGSPRSADLPAISDWIENKLRQLLDKNLVLPNMDDIAVSVMSGNPLLRFPFKR